MKVDLVRIGNSRGIRIPKPLIEQCGLGDTVELSVEHGRIIVAPEDHPRRGWADAFRKAGDSATDELLLAGSPNQFDREEWEWQLPIPGLTKSGWWNSIPWLVRKYKKRGHAW